MYSNTKIFKKGILQYVAYRMFDTYKNKLLKLEKIYLIGNTYCVRGLDDSVL